MLAWVCENVRMREFECFRVLLVCANQKQKNTYAAKVLDKDTRACARSTRRSIQEYMSACKATEVCTCACILSLNYLRRYY